jgi:hypothetical protein
VTYIDAGYGSRAVVQKFDNNNWEMIGSGPASAAIASYSSITTTNTELIITYLSKGVFAKKIALPPSTLPLNLISFKANKASGQSALLQWQTGSEQDVKNFDIYRRTDETIFIKIGTVAANTQSVNNSYAFYDKAPLNGNNYYQLMLMNQDGTTTVLGTAHLAFGFDSDNISAFPNPTLQNVTVSFTPNRYSSLNIFEQTGRKIEQRQIGPNASSITVDFSTYSKGIYFISLNGNGVTEAKKIVKQ